MIYISKGCPQIKTKVLIRGLGRCEGVGRKPECGFDDFACIRMFFSSVLIYVLYKSISLTLVTMIYSWDVL